MKVKIQEHACALDSPAMAQHPALSAPPRPQPWWSAHELVTLGVFAAAAKVSTLLVALAGGGMNPVSLLAKNLLFTTLLVVMLYKVRKPGTLSLFVLVNMCISMLLLGGSVTLLPAMLGAALLAEACVWATGGPLKAWGPLLAVAVYDVFFRVFSLSVSWLYMRENPSLLMAALPVVALGYVGAVLGLFTGVKAMKELRHAGIVRS